MKRQVMKMVSVALLTSSLGTLSSQAWISEGYVFCDANTNNLIDAGDVPVPSLLVVVTNTSGTFSNGNWTTAQGYFGVQLPAIADSYVTFVLGGTLPPGTVAVLPPSVSFSLTTNVTGATNLFLIRSPFCGPPGPQPGPWVSEGYVFCDANTNNLIDAGDVPVPGVQVAVTNLGGTFSNAVTTTAQGRFVVQLPPGTATYVSYVVASSLPLGTLSAAPTSVSFTLTPSTTTVTNLFLIQNTNCAGLQPPQPPPATNACWLTGGGTIKSKGKPIFTFGGNVHPGCNSEAGDGGSFNVVAHNANLHFKGEVFEVVNCGNVADAPPGSKSPKTPYNFIEFQGVGTLSAKAGGKKKNNNNYGVVYFYGRAEDRGEPGKGTDRLYLRVYTEAGQTVLLISADPNNPTTVAPAVISTGNLQLHVSSCDDPPQM